MAPYVHEHPFRVVMSEVDVAQIHFTNLFRWMDRGLSEWLAAIGHPFTELVDHGPGIPIVDARATFSGRIMLDDEIVLRTWVGDVGTTSFRTHHEFTRDGERVALGRLVHVCVERESRATLPVPGWITAHERPGPNGSPWEESRDGE